MTTFSKCPKCGLFDDRRSSCTCGYVTPAPPPAPAYHKPPASAPSDSGAKPSVWKRIVAVLLVIPIAFCLVVAGHSVGDGWVGWAIAILMGAVGFGLLALANYLWTGKTKAERERSGRETTR